MFLIVQLVFAYSCRKGHGTLQSDLPFKIRSDFKVVHLDQDADLAYKATSQTMPCSS